MVKRLDRILTQRSQRHGDTEFLSREFGMMSGFALLKAMREIPRAKRARYDISSSEAQGWDVEKVS